MGKFKLKKGEEGHVHLEIIKAEFDPKTGKQKFKPFVQTFTPKEYRSFLEYPNGMGVVKVHHLPEGVKPMEELRKAFDSKAKGSRRVNATDLSKSVPSMFDEKDADDKGGQGDNGGSNGVGDNGGDPDGGGSGDEIELKSMKNMKRGDLDEYAKQFDIDPTEYSNATVLKEAIQMEIDEKGLEE